MSDMVRATAGNQLTQMRRGAIEFCVLALLRADDCYGFEMAKALAEADGLVTSEGTLYPLLTRLRHDKYVDSYLVDSPQGPPRRYYRITRRGEIALDAFTLQWKSFRDSVDSLLFEEASR